MSLFDKHNEELDKMLQERGITREQWHQENLDARAQHVADRQKKPAKVRMEEAKDGPKMDFDEALLSYIAAAVRSYTENGITVIRDDEMKLADDLEAAERDYAKLQDAFVVTKAEREAINERRAEAFARLAKILPGMWW